MPNGAKPGGLSPGMKKHYCDFIMNVAMLKLTRSGAWEEVVAEVMAAKVK